MDKMTETERLHNMTLELGLVAMSIALTGKVAPEVLKSAREEARKVLKI